MWFHNLQYFDGTYLANFEGRLYLLESQEGIWLQKQILNTHSCNELRKTLDVYSKSKEVFEKLSAWLFGLEKANAVPNDDWLSAPISERLSLWYSFNFSEVRMLLRKECILFQ